VLLDLAVLRMLSRRLGIDGRLTPVEAGGRRAKALVLAPTRALVRERVDDWRLRFGSLGAVVAELAGPAPSGASGFEGGGGVVGGADDDADARDPTCPPDVWTLASADVVVATPEKADAVTRRRSGGGWIADIALLLIDEVHTLGDPGRGPCLEALVARLRSLGSLASLRGSPLAGIRCGGASATVPDAHRVAAWLGCRAGGLIQAGDETRPVPLTISVRGVPADCRSNEFIFTRSLPGRTWPLLREALGAGARSGEPLPCTLVFSSTRGATETTATALLAAATRDGLPPVPRGHPARAVLAAAAADPVARLRPTLATLVREGVGFHHAGLAPQERTVVERLFRRRCITVLCATTTLSLGVNLPAHLVVVQGTSMWNSEFGRSEEMSGGSLAQLLGRAGRLGLDREGRGLVLCRTGEEGDVRRRLGGWGRLHSRFLEGWQPGAGWRGSNGVGDGGLPAEAHGLREAILTEVCLRTVQSGSGARAFFDATYAARELADGAEGGAAEADALADAATRDTVEELFAAGLLVRPPPSSSPISFVDVPLAPSPAGMAVFEGRLTVPTAAAAHGRLALSPPPSTLLGAGAEDARPTAAEIFRFVARSVEVSAGTHVRRVDRRTLGRWNAQRWPPPMAGRGAAAAVGGSLYLLRHPVPDRRRPKGPPAKSVVDAGDKAQVILGARLCDAVPNGGAEGGSGAAGVAPLAGSMAAEAARAARAGARVARALSRALLSAVPAPSTTAPTDFALTTGAAASGAVVKVPVGSWPGRLAAGARLHSLARCLEAGAWPDCGPRLLRQVAGVGPLAAARLTESFAGAERDRLGFGDAGTAAAEARPLAMGGPRALAAACPRRVEVATGRRFPWGDRVVAAARAVAPPLFSVTLRARWAAGAGGDGQGRWEGEAVCSPVDVDAAGADGLPSLPSEGAAVPPVLLHAASSGAAGAVDRVNRAGPRAQGAARAFRADFVVGDVTSDAILAHCDASLGERRPIFLRFRLPATTSTASSPPPPTLVALVLVRGTVGHDGGCRLDGAAVEADAQGWRSVASASTGPDGGCCVETLLRWPGASEPGASAARATKPRAPNKRPPTSGAAEGVVASPAIRRRAAVRSAAEARAAAAAMAADGRGALPPADAPAAAPAVAPAAAPPPAPPLQPQIGPRLLPPAAAPPAPTPRPSPACRAPPPPAAGFYAALLGDTAPHPAAAPSRPVGSVEVAVPDLAARPPTLADPWAGLL